MRPTVKSFEILKVEDGGARHLEKSPLLFRPQFKRFRQNLAR